MKYINLIYLITCISLSFIFSSCIDDELPECDNNIEQSELYALTFSVSLDYMGGTRATYSELTDMENYIDPEKFRVLFFDENDKFLFESKSRWVKQREVTTSGEASRWFVSVPFFSSGNDTGEYDWPWEEIRTKLTSGSFKIAILANRPLKEWYPETKLVPLGGNQWIDNLGPIWTKNNSVCGGTDVKDVFDLHHCQYDPLYHGKGESVGYYDFIMGDWKSTWTDANYAQWKPTMGATSSWVEWQDDKGVSLGSGERPFFHPNYENPIPMYGIQIFNAISEAEWKKGTTFNLERPSDKNIFLLRSVVKLELLVPTDYAEPEYIAMAYPNLYARCEPLNNWTPTDQLWEEEENGKGKISSCDEIQKLLDYGPICQPSGGTGKNAYQNKLAWFYGVWQAKWDFNNNTTVTNKLKEYREEDKPVLSKFPQIFNPCIQRNTSVLCTKSKIEDSEYYHYVVYCGERNINDPSKLDNLENIVGGGQCILTYWMVNIGNKIYGIPITDYSGNNNPVRNLEPDNFNTGDKPSNVDAISKKDTGYEIAVMSMSGNSPGIPWPLVRNHVYKITLSRKNTRSAEAQNLGDLGIICEDLHSSSLNFSK